MDSGTVGRILLALLGMVFISVGCLLWSAPLAFIVSGGFCVLIAYVWQYLRAAGVSNEVS
jgi:hypothetical protein